MRSSNAEAMKLRARFRSQGSERTHRIDLPATLPAMLCADVAQTELRRDLWLALEQKNTIPWRLRNGRGSSGTVHMAWRCGSKRFLLLYGLAFLPLHGLAWIRSSWPRCEAQRQPSRHRETTTDVANDAPGLLNFDLWSRRPSGKNTGAGIPHVAQACCVAAPNDALASTWLVRKRI